jgi:S-formylglutathione hydrolase FrmB
VLEPKSAPRSDRGLLVLLHGRTDELDGPRTMLSDELFRALEQLGSSAPAVLLVNGGESGYFHDRLDQPWGRYVTEEAIPAGLARAHARRDRVAIGGFSMGGYGALDIAALNRGRFCAVGGHSPAIFASAAATAPGAFDNADDFAEHDVLARARAHDPYAGTPVWLDVGESDPFRATTEQLGAEIHRPVHVWPGGHEGAYWRRHMAAYMRFYARALASCN